jgi:hypothetical protein
LIIAKGLSPLVQQLILQWYQPFRFLAAVLTIPSTLSFPFPPFAALANSSADNPDSNTNAAISSCAALILNFHQPWFNFAINRR